MKSEMITTPTTKVILVCVSDSIHTIQTKIQTMLHTILQSVTITVDDNDNKYTIHVTDTIMNRTLFDIIFYTDEASRADELRNVYIDFSSTSDTMLRLRVHHILYMKLQQDNDKQIDVRQVEVPL